MLHLLFYRLEMMILMKMTELYVCSIIYIQYMNLDLKLCPATREKVDLGVFAPLRPVPELPDTPPQDRALSP